MMLKPAKNEPRDLGCHRDMKSLRTRAGFTMIEMLAVLAVIVTLATIATMNVMESIKTARRDSEAASLVTLEDGLRTAIVQTKSIPAAAHWEDPVVDYLAMRPSSLTNTTIGTQRRLLYDPAFRVGTNTTSVPPFTQGNNGSLQPVSPRVVILSSLLWELPTLGTDAVTFSNIWNTPRMGVPAGWAAGWGTKCPDLSIERMDLRDLFSCVILENLDMSNAAPYSLETGVNASVPAGARKQMWVIKTTVVNFLNPDNTLQWREYVTQDASYTYEYGRWGRYTQYGPNRGCGWFGVMTDQFREAAAPPGKTQRYPKQQWVADAMYDFLYNFGQWSLDSFVATNPAPGYIKSCAATNALITFGADLVK